MERIKSSNRIQNISFGAIIGIYSIILGCSPPEPKCVGQINAREFNQMIDTARNSLIYRPDQITDLTGLPWMGRCIPIIHPQVYPNGEKARQEIEKVLPFVTSEGGIHSRLTTVHDSIPNDATISTKLASLAPLEQELTAIQHDSRALQKTCLE